MTNARLAAMDARIHRGMARSGLADTCSVRSPAGVVTEGVRCIVARGVQVITDEASVTSNATTIDLLRADLPEGVGRRWTIVLPDLEYTIDSEPQIADESIVRYLLRRK
ncbi:TPA_asm: putative head-tail joining protein [Cyanophage Cy-LDV1]|jgi:hypothetical protein|nr:TPA_asm: putative head-tail joining protein [Cyanophage Cy-LDV1]